MVSLRIKKHCQVGSNIGINQQTIRSESHQESQSLSEVSCIDLLEHIPSWSQTGKRWRYKTTAVIVDDNQKIDNNKIYNVMPLSVYYGPEVSPTQTRLEGLLITSNQSLLTRKKHKNTDQTMPIVADTDATLELLGKTNQTTINKISKMHGGFERRPIFSESKLPSSCSHGRQKNPKRAKEVKSEHRCEICGKAFVTGQSLGGHKTYHRAKPVVVELVDRKLASTFGETGEIRDFINRMLLPMELYGKGCSSEDSYQQHPKKLLDLDLNIPYVG